MKKLGLNGRRLLLTFHLFFASVWIGTAISMNLILLLKGRSLNMEELYVFTMIVKLLDDFLIIPSTAGILLTGLLISMMTNWGFFKLYWVTVKWILTIVLIISGAFWLLPWLNSMTAISQSLLPLKESAYAHYRTMLLVFGSAQALLLVFMILISVYKPGGKSRKERYTHV